MGLHLFILGETYMKSILKVVLAILTLLSFNGTAGEMLLGHRSCSYSHQEDGMEIPQFYSNIRVALSQPCPQPPAPDSGHLSEPWTLISSTPDVTTYATTTRGNKNCVIAGHAIDVTFQ